MHPVGIENSETGHQSVCPPASPVSVSVSRIPSFLISAEVCLCSFELGWFGSEFRTKFLFSRLPGAGSPRQAQELHCIQNLPSVGATDYDAFISRYGHVRNGSFSFSSLNFLFLFHSSALY